MTWYDRTLVVLCLVMLFAVCRQLSSITSLLSEHNHQQNKYSVVSNEYAKVISSTIAKAQLDIARIDDRWEKQRQEDAKYKKQVELLELQLKKARESK